MNKLGCSLVQFNEPYLLVNDIEYWETIYEAYKLALSNFKGKKMVNTYFGNAEPYIEKLSSLPVDIIGIDLYETSLEVLKNIAAYKEVALGIIDVRNSHVESVESIVETVQNVLKTLNGNNIHLCTNGDLEFVPESIARQKINVLCSAQRCVDSREVKICDL